MNEYILSIMLIIFFISAFIILFCYGYITRQNILSWLLWAVIEAEKQLGSGTGRLKLSMVYNMFIKQFPIISKFITFDIFAKLVDIALDQMRILLDNKDIEKYVRGGGTI